METGSAQFRDDVKRLLNKKEKKKINKTVDIKP